MYPRIDRILYEEGSQHGVIEVSEVILIDQFQETFRNGAYTEGRANIPIHRGEAREEVEQLLPQHVQKRTKCSMSNTLK